MEPLAHKTRATLRGIHESHAAAEHGANGRLEQGIMGAAEDEGVDAMAAQRGQVFPEHVARDLVIQPVFLHQRHEQWAGDAADADMDV